VLQREVRAVTAEENVTLVREAYGAYTQGDTATLLDADRGLRMQLEEIVGHGDKVLVVVP
jgi:hypothetical protein